MAEILPPEAFGKYELLEKIASGGMAEVYRARARGIAGFEKILVIKRLADRLAVNKEFTDLFIDEARISVQLQHPNIVQVFELDAVNNQYYMAMEYVQGLDLARLMLRARTLGMFSIPLALFVAGEMLKALQFAHTCTDDAGNPRTRTSAWIPWAELMLRVFGIDPMVCGGCGVRLKIRAVVKVWDIAREILDGLATSRQRALLQPARDGPVG